MTDLTDLRWENFEKVGEEQVRKQIAEQQYGEEKQRAADAWLAWKAERATAASQAEANSISRDASAAASRAAAAAERSATAAERANIRATLAIAISAVSAISIIVIAFLSRH